jgi:hypothetical protein
MRWLRRFCGGSVKPLKLLVRLFAAAVRAVVRGGSQKPNKINVRLFCGGCGVGPPYPLCASRRFWSAARAHGSREGLALGHQ